MALALGLLCSSPSTAGPFDALLSPRPERAAAEAEPLATPVEYRSANGELAVTLEARATETKLGRYTISGATYNGVYGGPVLRVKPGDMLRVHLVNHLAQATNVHFHGLAVSPTGHGDNSMKMVQPGEAWDYVIPIPKDHPPGVYWFHTHGHQFAERQLMGGLSGTLVVEGFQDRIPATLPLKERLFALKEFATKPDGALARVPKPYNVVIKTINGQLTPRIDIQPGETQLWRLSDQTANTYFRLTLDGASFTVIGRDAQPLARPEVVRELMLGPAERADVLVTGPPAGVHKLVAEKVTSGPGGDMFAAQTMATVVSAASGQAPVTVDLAALSSDAGAPIPGDKIDARRDVIFSSDAVTGLFFINHATFDHERIDVQVPLGSTEEWTIRNAADELHIFHIHQVRFQVVSVNGKPVPFEGLRDTVSVPIHGEVKIRIAFTDPVILGRFMFHCHILEHEDKGMMAQIEVYDPKVGPMPPGMDMEGMDHVAMAAPSRQETTTASGNGNAEHAAHH